MMDGTPGALLTERIWLARGIDREPQLHIPRSRHTQRTNQLPFSRTSSTTPENFPLSLCKAMFDLQIRSAHNRNKQQTTNTINNPYLHLIVKTNPTVSHLVFRGKEPFHPLNPFARSPMYIDDTSLSPSPYRRENATRTDVSCDIRHQQERVV